MEFNAYSMLVDFMWAGIFLFVAKMLREKIKILQSLFVPVSLLAGFIGLALGQNGFGIISFSSQFGSYAGLLIIAVFVSIGLRALIFQLVAGKQILIGLAATTASAILAGRFSMQCRLFLQW